MIETKEQYEAFKKDIEGASSYRASTNSEFSAGDLLETIEALRKVVGAAEDLVDIEQTHWSDWPSEEIYEAERLAFSTRYHTARNVLPDWLKGE